MAAVMKIFHTSAHHYLTVGSGLDVCTADLIDMQGTASTKLHLIMERCLMQIEMSIGIH